MIDIAKRVKGNGPKLRPKITKPAGGARSATPQRPPPGMTEKDWLRATLRQAVQNTIAMTPPKERRKRP